MKKMKKFILLLLIIFLKVIPSFSQEKEILILNYESKNPVQYANIKFLNSQNGTFSDENGLFVLNNKINDSAYISVLGYKNKIFWSESIPDTLYLKQKIISLEEVRLSSKQKDYGYFKKKSKFIRSQLKRTIVAMYISNKNNEKYISTLYYRIKKYGNKPSIVRPHLYSINKENGNPDKELLDKNMIISVKDKNNILSIDVSKNNILFPEEGVFVALEWVGNTTDIGFGYSKLKENESSYALLTSLEFKKQIWIPLTPKKEDKTIAHFGITVE